MHEHLAEGWVPALLRAPLLFGTAAAGPVVAAIAEAGRGQAVPALERRAKHGGAVAAHRRAAAVMAVVVAAEEAEVGQAFLPLQCEARQRAAAVIALVLVAVVALRPRGMPADRPNCRRG